MSNLHGYGMQFINGTLKTIAHSQSNQIDHLILFYGRKERMLRFNMDLAGKMLRRLGPIDFVINKVDAFLVPSLQDSRFFLNDPRVHALRAPTLGCASVIPTGFYNVRKRFFLIQSQILFRVPICFSLKLVLFILEVCRTERSVAQAEVSECERNPGLDDKNIWSPEGTAQGTHSSLV